MANKLSSFNYFPKVINENEKGQFVFNTLSRNLVFIPEDIDINKLTKECAKADQKTIDFLRSKGMVIDSEEDELELLKSAILCKQFYQGRLFLTIIPTDACNFNCIYCYQNHKCNFMKEEIAARILKWLDKNLRFYSELSINWFGGEPLLCKSSMVRMMKCIKDLCVKHKVAMVSSVTTNGYELDIASFKSLVSNGLLYYQITVDGNRLTHNQQRPHKTQKDSYGVIIDNLKRIKQLPNRYRFEVGIRINVSGNMRRQDIYEFIDEMAQMFANDKRFVLIWQWVRNWGGSRMSAENAEILVKEGEYCLEFADRATKKGLYCADLISAASGTDVCEAFYRNGYVINFDGKIFKCAMRMDDELNNCIGELTESGSMHINEKAEGRWLRQDEIGLRCRSCVFLPMCLSNRCHYRSKILGEVKCIEYRDFIDKQIETMIKKKKYNAAGAWI